MRGRSAEQRRPTVSGHSRRWAGGVDGRRRSATVPSSNPHDVADAACNQRGERRCWPGWTDRADQRASEHITSPPSIVSTAAGQSAGGGVDNQICHGRSTAAPLQVHRGRRPAPASDVQNEEHQVPRRAANRLRLSISIRICLYSSARPPSVLARLPCKCEKFDMTSPSDGSLNASCRAALYSCPCSCAANPPASGLPSSL